MKKKIKTLLLFTTLLTMLCGCTSKNENVQVTETVESIVESTETVESIEVVESTESNTEESTEAVESTELKLMIEGEYLGVNMEYDNEKDECYIDTDDIRLIAEDGTVKNIVERLGGKYECLKSNDKAKWQIGTTEWEVSFVRSTLDDGSIVASFEAYRNGEALSICDGYAEVVKDDSIVGNFKLSTKDLQSLLQVQTEINYEDGTVNLVPVYMN